MRQSPGLRQWLRKAMLSPHSRCPVDAYVPLALSGLILSPSTLPIKGAQ